jgi:hypothetical protein
MVCQFPDFQFELLDPAPKKGKSLLEIDLPFQKISRLSIKRWPHFNGKIYDQWDIFPAAWELC